MAKVLLIILTVTSYHLYFIGNDADYASIIESSTKELPGLNLFTWLDSFMELEEVNPDLIDIIIASDSGAILNEKVKVFSETFEIPTLFLFSGEPADFTFYSDFTSKCLSDTIISLINYFSLSQSSIIWTYSNSNLEVIEKTHNENSKITQISFLSESTADISGALIKILKQEGIQNFFILPDQISCENLLKGFKASYLNKEGYVAIMFTTCIHEDLDDGSLILAYESLESANSSYIYKELLIGKFFQSFIERDLSSYDISLRLKRIYNSKCKFSIVNVQGGLKKTVGKVDNGDVQIDSSIVYFGGIQDLSNFTQAKIFISANTGSFNPNGASPAYTNIEYQQGTYFAVEKINRDHSYFTNFQFELYDKVDCGVSVFDYNYSKDCFTKHRPHMGISYIPPQFPSAMPFMKQLYQLKLNIQFIGGIGSSGLLSSKTEYPYFVRTVSPSSDFSSAWANLIRLYGWNKIIVHYSNDSFGITAYKILNDSHKDFGFEFINDQKYREVNTIWNYESVSPYYSNMKNSMSLGCNIVFLIMGDPTPFFWLEGLYDLGVRRGDYTFVLFTVTGLASFYQGNANGEKRKELMHGSFAIYNGAWVGEYGESVKQEYLKYRNNAWGKSYFIDAVYTAAETADFLLKQGKPFEDIDVFNQAIRSVRFIGTTGTISFNPDTNNRNMFYFNVFNFYEDDQGNWHDDGVALISPLGTVYYTVIQEAVWVNGEIPKSMKEKYENCPFREDQIRDSTSAVKIKISVSFILLLISSIITIYSLHKIRFRKIVMMQVKSHIVFEDYLTLGFIFIEALQMISIGPPFVSFNNFLSNLSEILSFNISKVTQFKDTTFWIIFFSMIFLSYLWIIIIFMCSFRVFRCFPVVLNKLESFKNFLIPIMSNYLFLPIIVSLISILMCDKAISEDYTDSYLNYDCNMYCWRDDHIFYATLACIQIVIYIPVAILYRTLWQEENQMINIRTNSVFLIFKNICVVVLVILGKILKKDYELIHGITFLIISFVLFIVALIINHPYNYDRANLLSKLMIFCVFWNTIVCMLGSFVVNESYASVSLQLLGWLSIIISGLLIQKKLPQNLLVSIPGRNISDLFKFAFGIQSFQKSIYILDEEEGLSLNEEKENLN